MTMALGNGAACSGLQSARGHAGSEFPRRGSRVHATMLYLSGPEGGTPHVPHGFYALLLRLWRSSGLFPGHTADSSSKCRTSIPPDRSFPACNICRTWRFSVWHRHPDQKGHVEMSQARNSSHGVAQSIFLLEKCTLPNDFPDMTIPYEGRHAAQDWGARPAGVIRREATSSL